MLIDEKIENKKEGDKNMEENPKKSFWPDKKNVAIVILSVLVFMFAGALGSSDDTTNTISSSTNVALEEATQENNDEQIINLTNQLNEANEKISSLEKQLDEKNQYVLNLESQVGSLTAEKSQAEAQIGILQQQLSAKSSSATSSSGSTSSGTSTSYTVYITNTGSKYHRSGCSYLRQSSHAIDKNSAISQGYTPCSRCNP